MSLSSSKFTVICSHNSNRLKDLKTDFAIPVGISRFSGAFSNVVSTSFIVGVLRIVQMTGYPVALEESFRGQADVVLDGLP